VYLSTKSNLWQKENLHQIQEKFLSVKEKQGQLKNLTTSTHRRKRRTEDRVDNLQHLNFFTIFLSC
jgi:hypothetical protein